MRDPLFPSTRAVAAFYSYTLFIHSIAAVFLLVCVITIIIIVIYLPGIYCVHQTIHNRCSNTHFTQLLFISTFLPCSLYSTRLMIVSYTLGYYMYTCMYIVRTCMYVHVCMYVCIYVCMYVCMYICTYVRMYVCRHRQQHDRRTMSGMLAGDLELQRSVCRF